MKKLLTGLSLAPLIFAGNVNARQPRPVLAAGKEHQPASTPLPAN